MEIENIDSLGLSDEQKSSLQEKLESRLVDVVRSSVGGIAAAQAKDVVKEVEEEIHPKSQSKGKVKF